MELLQGKALNAFKDYIKKENGWTSQDFKDHYKCQGDDKYTCTDIFEWLDSVNISIVPKLFAELWEYNIFKDGGVYFTCPADIDLLDSRQKATKHAIIKAVEIVDNEVK